ncbi:MAG: hypothetical protein JXX14_07405 [Deltaproteobacteria bacterium]|nr:hypothetical protein [Deltaproteobacteria bacterium]
MRCIIFSLVCLCFAGCSDHSQTPSPDSESGTEHSTDSDFHTEHLMDSESRGGDSSANLDSDSALPDTTAKLDTATDETTDSSTETVTATDAKWDVETDTPSGTDIPSDSEQETESPPTDTDTGADTVTETQSDTVIDTNTATQSDSQTATWTDTEQTDTEQNDTEQNDTEQNDTETTDTSVDACQSGDTSQCPVCPTECINVQGAPIDGCGAECGGLAATSCPSDDLECAEPLFPSYDSGGHCVPKQLFECEVDTDCRCLPSSMQGCSWDFDSSDVVWHCNRGRCMGRCADDVAWPWQ